jgi:hypothetical protein
MSSLPRPRPASEFSSVAPTPDEQVTSSRPSSAMPPAARRSRPRAYEERAEAADRACDARISPPGDQPGRSCMPPLCERDVGVIRRVRARAVWRARSRRRARGGGCR